MLRDHSYDTYYMDSNSYLPEIYTVFLWQKTVNPIE